MGFDRHHAIVVTSQSNKYIEKAWKEAFDIFVAEVSKIIESKCNNTKSFFVAPDGSKEGWDESNEGDKRRDKFIQFLREECGGIDWVEIQYGSDDGVTKVVRSNQHPDSTG